MSKKILNASFPEKCIGCDLCVFACLRQKGKIGLSGSPIKILNSDSGFKIHIDPSVNNLDTKKIVDICPKGVYTLESITDTDSFEFKVEDNDK